MKSRFTAAIAMAFGWALLPARVDADGLQWVEAESYVAQEGSTAARYEMPTASGGACINHGWGGKAGDSVRYRIEIPQGSDYRWLTLRCARETQGPAALEISIDQAPAIPLEPPSTGDWGFKPEGWAYAPVELPSIKPGRHELTIRSRRDGGNVNLDGFYLSARKLDTSGAPAALPPSGPELVAAVDSALSPLPCRTPLSAPAARRKAFVTGGGALHTLIARPNGGMGGAVAGPTLRIVLADREAWKEMNQKLIPTPVPTVVTTLRWPGIAITQSAFAAAPESQGFWIRTRVENLSDAPQDMRFLVLPSGAPPGAQAVRMNGAHFAEDRHDEFPGPLGSGGRQHIEFRLAARESRQFDVQFLGDGGTWDEAVRTTTAAWDRHLSPAAKVVLPDPILQDAYDASLRMMLALVEPVEGEPARILKGLQGYYGANPYDTLQVSRALDGVGLREQARELLRHQVAHLKDDGIFEMWETGNLKKPGPEQWIVQGLAAQGIWNHWLLWQDDEWLKEAAPALVKAAEATLRIRQPAGEVHLQGRASVAGWLCPVGGDGGLPVGYHWSQNAGPLAGARIAAAAARHLSLPATKELSRGYDDFRKYYDRVLSQCPPDQMLPSMPGADPGQRERNLWGVVMSVTAFDAIPADNAAAVRTLRFLQQHQQAGLHLNLGYSAGVWPYMSAEVALWHARLGEFEESWRILRAIVRRASRTFCWYEEIENQPPRGHADPADAWAAAEMVWLTRQLLAWQQDDGSLFLCPGLPAEWLAPGKPIQAGPLPLPGGACSFQIKPGQDETSLELDFRGAPPRQLRVCLWRAADSAGTVTHLQGAASARRSGRELILDAPAMHVRVTVQSR